MIASVGLLIASMAAQGCTDKPSSGGNVAVLIDVSESVLRGDNQGIVKKALVALADFAARKRVDLHLVPVGTLSAMSPRGITFLPPGEVANNQGKLNGWARSVIDEVGTALDEIAARGGASETDLVTAIVAARRHLRASSKEGDVQAIVVLSDFMQTGGAQDLSGFQDKGVFQADTWEQSVVDRLTEAARDHGVEAGADQPPKNTMQDVDLIGIVLADGASRTDGGLRDAVFSAWRAAFTRLAAPPKHFDASVPNFDSALRR